jgi:hypothetical protein
MGLLEHSEEKNATGATATIENGEQNCTPLSVVV